MGEVFQPGQLVQYNENWKARAWEFKNPTHDNHIQVVTGYKQHDDKSYAYFLFCTEDGRIDVGGTHESWLEPIVFWEDING